MKESQDIKMFKRFQDSFRKWSGHFRILEQRIPVEEQMEYFKYAEKLRKKEGRENVSETDLPALQSELNDPDVSVSHKKYLLALLASLHLVKAYRIVEEYAEAPDPEMANWAYMALMESRIVLESDLSDEKQILISTGMGGKGENGWTPDKKGRDLRLIQKMPPEEMAVRIENCMMHQPVLP